MNGKLLMFEVQYLLNFYLAYTNGSFSNNFNTFSREDAMTAKGYMLERCEGYFLTISKLAKNYLFWAVVFSYALAAQSLSQGPAQGSVTEFKVVTTDNYRVASKPVFAEKIGRNKKRNINKSAKFIDAVSPFKSMDIYRDDGKVNAAGDSQATVLLRNFQGDAQTNSIPPDPNIAVGPRHIVSCVNSQFSIYDKNGNRLITIDASTWFGADPFDPKVIYDHYAKRWVMVWLDQSDANKTGYFLISVSDDSIPLGRWNNFKLPAHDNGDTYDGTWSDYEGVGFDDKAIYLTGDQFSFAGNYGYAKIRIVPKDNLYAAAPSAVNYFDFWDIREPSNLFNTVFNIRPSISFSNSADFFLINCGYGGNYVNLYKISNPTTAPALSGVTVPVVPFDGAPTPRQLNDNPSLLIEGSSSPLTNEPVYRNGKLYMVHTIQNPIFPQNSAVHYVVIDPIRDQSVEEGILGADGYYYLYPAIMVDKSNNIAVSYSRSAATEYIGAYFSSKLAGDVPGLKSSKLSRAGTASYTKDFGSGRNRWGDYMGIALDPENNEHVWMLTEYVSSRNVWDTWIGEIRMTPFQGATTFTITKSINFSNIEIGYSSSLMNVDISNFGNLPYTIDSIKNLHSNFIITNPLTSARIMNSYDTLSVKMKFTPTLIGNQTDSLFFYSGSSVISVVPLEAKGYAISLASNNSLYGIDQSANFLSVNITNALATQIGYTLTPSVVSAAVHPKTKVVYGLTRETDASCNLLRINAEGGDAYQLVPVSVTGLGHLAFDTAGVLYGAARTGLLYKINISTGEAVKIDSIKTMISSIAFHPVTNELWAAAFKVIGTGKDRIVKVNMTTGDTTLVGNTGFNLPTLSLAFDETGQLFGIRNSGLSSILFTINTINGTGTDIGSAGRYLSSLAYSGNSIFAGIKPPIVAMKTFSLGQNYPNPFNPSTTIKYSLSSTAKVSLKVFDILGNEVLTMVNEEQPPGSYVKQFTGTNLSSGVYFYRLSAGGSTATRKMTLLK